jgi:hypothetical protein
MAYTLTWYIFTTWSSCRALHISSQEADLRINYSKFWLSLIAPASEEVNADRRKYAKLVGNIGPDLVC